MSIESPDDFSMSSAGSSMITSDWSPDGACIFLVFGQCLWGKEKKEKKLIRWPSNTIQGLNIYKQEMR